MLKPMIKASEFNNIVPFHRSSVNHTNQPDNNTTFSELEGASIHLWYLTPAFSCNVWRSQSLADTWHILIHGCSNTWNQLDKVVFEATLLGKMHDVIRVVKALAGTGTPCWVNYDSGFGVWLYRWYDSIAGEWIELEANTAD